MYHNADKLTVLDDNQNWAGKLGIPGVPGNIFPVFNSTGNGAASWSAGPGTGWRIFQDELDWSDDMTKTIGHHDFEWGWEALRVREDDSGPESESASSEPLPSGSYTFSGITTVYLYDKPNTGNSFASFLVEFSVLSFETEAPWFVDGGAAQLPKRIETWPPLNLG